MITAQEIFDRTVRHLHDQGQKCGNGTTCLYRGENNLRCAVGYWIPDDRYTAKIEGNTVPHLIENYVLPADIAEHDDLLGDLQRSHDGAEIDDSRAWANVNFTDGIACKLKRVARNRSLSDALVRELWP